MKFLIISDVHGNISNLNLVLNRHKGINVLNAGDTCISRTILEKLDLVSVAGNCDLLSKLPLIRIIELDDKKVFLTHGHVEHVKYGLEKLAIKAQVLGADICIFGHRHQKFLKEVNNILFINPGSLANGEYAIYDNGEVIFLEV